MYKNFSSKLKVFEKNFTWFLEFGCKRFWIYELLAIYFLKITYPRNYNKPINPEDLIVLEKIDLSDEEFFELREEIRNL